MGVFRGIDEIARERDRQIIEEGFGSQHDRQHEVEDFVEAAIAYAAAAREVTSLPGKTDSIMRLVINRHDRRRRLVIAGALIAAAIDRLDAEERNPS